MAVLYAKDTKVRIQAALASVATTDNVYDLMVTTPTDIESYMKNVTFSIPEGAVEKQDYLGVTPAGYQNGELTMKPYSEGSMSGTLVLQNTMVFEKFFMGSTATAITSGTRYGPGCFTSGSDRSDVCIASKIVKQGLWPGGADTKVVCISMNNAVVTKVGDYRISGADGHWEIDIEAKCMPKDFYIEYQTS